MIGADELNKAVETNTALGLDANGPFSSLSDLDIEIDFDALRKHVKASVEVTQPHGNEILSYAWFMLGVRLGYEAGREEK